MEWVAKVEAEAVWAGHRQLVLVAIACAPIPNVGIVSCTKRVYCLSLWFNRTRP